MKNTVIAFAVFSALSAAGAAQAASTGTIIFNGELTANTCDAVVDNQANNATVTLPTVGTNQLTTKGNTAGRTGFNIVLSNCAGPLNTASALFEAGSTVDLPSGHLKNTSQSPTGAATNVSLRLLDLTSPSSAVIQVGNSNQTTNTAYVDVSSGSANLPYAVEYFADGTTTAGSVSSSVVYFIQYM